MEWKRYLEEEVHRHYWQHDHTCANTTLAIESELFSIPVASQVMDAAWWRGL